MTVRSVWHTSFTVADLDRSIAFYRDLLGLSLRHVQDQDNAYTRLFVGYPDAHLRIAQFELPGASPGRSGHVLELVQYLQPSGPAVRPERYQPGASHLAFEIEELRSVHKRFAAAGVDFVSDPVEITEGINRGGATVYLHDPDGCTLELVQPPPLEARSVEQTECTDGRTREMIVTVPPGHVRAVVVLFHPFGFDPEAVLDGEPAGERLLVPLEPAAPIADLLGLALVAPRAFGRAAAGASLGAPAQLDAAMDVACRVARRIGAPRIVTGGLSMGGLEALLLAERYPDEIEAVWVANPVVDPAAWYEDMHAVPVAVLLEGGVPELMCDEIGNPPADDPDAWRERSALARAGRLTSLRVRVDWSPHDAIVPNQGGRQGGAIAAAVRAAGGEVDERRLTRFDVGIGDPGRTAHERCDVASGLAFLARETAR